MGATESFLAGVEVLDDTGFESFFAPSSVGYLDPYLAEYRKLREDIEAVAAFAKGPQITGVLKYFVEGNTYDSSKGRSLYLANGPEQLFCPEPAIAELNADFWRRALALTDVYEAMPQVRRDRWIMQLRNPQGVRSRGDSSWEVEPLPDFVPETAYPTLEGLLASRATFFAERVDGLFRALSGEHVTNSPAAFGKRMIIAGVADAFGYIDCSRSGYIHDLRCVIARFMGREEAIDSDMTRSVLRYARENPGEWVVLDGGALRVRVYQVGTAHLEVHPLMAYRLNGVLAHLYPTAIPPQFRSKPTKKAKNFPVLQRPVSFAVVQLLSRLQPAQRLVKGGAEISGVTREPVLNTVAFSSDEILVKVAPQVRDEFEKVIGYLGGVKIPLGQVKVGYAFSYAPFDVIRIVAAAGTLPEQRTHQFYPTPASIAESAVALAMIEPKHTCLEPSAGTGALADFMPKEQLTCVEISALHCAVLEAKGYCVEQADFLAWEPAGFAQGRRFDRVVLNPPYSEGRWQLHLAHAGQMTAIGGRLVAVLPASAMNKDVLPDWECEWGPSFHNEFAGTSVSVVLLAATRRS